MKTSDFFYHLPQECIAQSPAEPRDSSKLMVLRRNTGDIRHAIFRGLGDYLNPGDCLILNDTKVMPARLYGRKEDTGARVEFLLLNQIVDYTPAIAPGRSPQVWECLAGPGKKAKPGARFLFGGVHPKTAWEKQSAGQFDRPILTGEVREVLPNGNRVVAFTHEGSFYEMLERVGEMPLPHYITTPLDDAARYNTIYARESGSAAAPTAGLHFTPELLEQLQGQGIAVGYVTLHVGLGTFRPVKAEHIEDHAMHAEHYGVPEETAALINKTKAEGGKVVGVGTTCCRTLESVMRQYGAMRACEGWTDIFLFPGCEFRCIDALLTNFHLPESTLIMLVSAFHGRENTLAAYKTAVREGYRFYSFGDCMLIH